ncbi:MAG: hypothetical protein GWN00_14225, partial [Aliifodinibius sp.]|nr:hypothetical protein [Fodinibius sp.]NIY25919.1 hypothetical protein [Fodinibius sp.]
MLRLKTGNVQSMLESVRKDWKAAVPDLPFDFTFLDEQADQMYRSEQRFSNFMMVFAALAIFIACLGLYGLV